MNIKQLSKYDRYVRILEVCKGKVLPCNIVSDLVFIGEKSTLLDCRILTKFKFLKETLIKVGHLGRPTKHFTTLIDSLNMETFKRMTEESAYYWQKTRRTPQTKKKNKPVGIVPDTEYGNFEPLYQLLGLVAHGEFKPLPRELITTFDINENKEKVNESIRYDAKKSPRAYPGTSAGMDW